MKSIKKAIATSIIMISSILPVQAGLFTPKEVDQAKAQQVQMVSYLENQTILQQFDPLSSKDVEQVIGVVSTIISQLHQIESHLSAGYNKSKGFVKSRVGDALEKCEQTRMNLIQIQQSLQTIKTLDAQLSSNPVAALKNLAEFYKDIELLEKDVQLVNELEKSGIETALWKAKIRQSIEVALRFAQHSHDNDAKRVALAVLKEA